jgi:hypothetical protein
VANQLERGPGTSTRPHVHTSTRPHGAG